MEVPIRGKDLFPSGRAKLKVRPLTRTDARCPTVGTCLENLEFDLST